MGDDGEWQMVAPALIPSLPRTAYDLPSESQSDHDDEPFLQAFYTPSGKWAHMAHTPIESIVCGPPVNYDEDTEGPERFFAKGLAKGAVVPFVCKKYDVWRYWPGFHTEMFLLASSQHLRTFQGTHVSSIISVQSAPGGFLTVNFEPMSRKGWTDAHPQLTSHYLKERIIHAYTRIHAQGILHGDVSLRNIIVEQRGGKVHILNFQKARALVPFPVVGLAACTPKDLEIEMRHVRFIIDFHGAQKREETLWADSGPGGEAAWNKANALRSKRSANRNIPGQPHELWDTEKGKWRVFDTRNTWFPIQEPRPSRAAILPKTFLDDCVPEDDEWLDTVAEMIEADARQHQTRERRYRLEKIQSYSCSTTPSDTTSLSSPSFPEPLLPSPIVEPSGEASNASPSSTAYVLPSLSDNGPVQQKRDQLVAIDAVIWAQKGAAEDVIQAKSSCLLRMIQDLEQSDLDELMFHAKSHKSAGKGPVSASTSTATSVPSALKRDPRSLDRARATSRSATPLNSEAQSSTSRTALRLLGRRGERASPTQRASDSWDRPPRSSPQDSRLRNPGPSQTIRRRRSFLAPRNAPKSDMLPPAARPSSSSGRDSRIRRPRGPLHLTEFPPVRREGTPARRSDLILSSFGSSRLRARASSVAPVPLAKSMVSFPRPRRDPTTATDHDPHTVPRSSSTSEHRKEGVAMLQQGRRSFEGNAYSGPGKGRPTDTSIDHAALPSTHRVPSSSPSAPSSPYLSEENEVEAVLTKGLDLSEPIDAMTPDVGESSASSTRVLDHVITAHSEPSSSNVLSPSNPRNDVGSVTSKRKRDDDAPDDAVTQRAEPQMEARPEVLDPPLAKGARSKKNDEPTAKRIRLALAFMNLFKLKQQLDP